MHRLCFLRILSCCATAYVLLFLILPAHAGDSPEREGAPEAAVQDPSADSADEVEFRLREGLNLEDELGEFRDAGGRIAFYPNDRRITLTVLENLALERVYGELERRSERRLWVVDGVISEYRGGNYLQITRAIMRPKESLTHESAQRKLPATDSSDTPRP